MLLLCQYVESTYARELLAAGAGGVGYLLKDRVTDLARARRTRSSGSPAGGTVLDPEVVEQLLPGRARTR